MEHDRGRLRDGGVCGGGPRGEDLRPRAAPRRARHEAAGRVRRGLAGKYHEIIISIMLQMEMAFLVSIHILCRTFQTNVPFSNESWVNKRNITFFASKPFLWQLCNIILKVSFYIPPDRDLWYCFTSFCIYEKSLWWIQMHKYIVIITLTCYAFACKCILFIVLIH